MCLDRMYICFGLIQAVVFTSGWSSWIGLVCLLGGLLVRVLSSRPPCAGRGTSVSLVRGIVPSLLVLKHICAGRGSVVIRRLYVYIQIV